ncbi:amidase [Acinetobacter soli]|uniref:amidase n=1 Tax=Acinetobacter soli TaxID=487316 RepID=UPI001F402BBA|nr:amidase [Acinetobacter soli]MCE6008461.1 amidase [Acinetobacter soli]
MDHIFSKKISVGNGIHTVAIKDTIHIQGFQTCAGSAALSNTQEEQHHADIIEYLVKNNCSVVGKTNLHELAFGITGINHFTGTSINPKYPTLIPGGSSSGSAAAVAAGLVDFSIGTDTGGSIRMPATCCGVFGLKPTYGRVSRNGVLPEYSSLDCVGPFAATIDLLTHAMTCIDPSFVAADVPKASPKFALLDVQADELIWNSIHSYLKVCGLENLPKLSVAHFDEAYDAGMQIINYENYQAFHHLIDTDLLGIDVASRLKNAAKTSSTDVMQANQIREQFRRALDVILEQYDAVLLPTLPQLPPKLEDAENTAAFLNLTALVRPFNLSGHPAVSIPLETTAGQPVGLQMVTRHFNDPHLCAYAAYLVKAYTSNSKEM